MDPKNPDIDETSAPSSDRDEREQFVRPQQDEPISEANDSALTDVDGDAAEDDEDAVEESR